MGSLTTASARRRLEFLPDDDEGGIIYELGILDVILRPLLP